MHFIGTWRPSLFIAYLISLKLVIYVFCRFHIFNSFFRKKKVDTRIGPEPVLCSKFFYAVMAVKAVVIYVFAVLLISFLFSGGKSKKRGHTESVLTIFFIRSFLLGCRCHFLRLAFLISLRFVIYAVLFFSFIFKEEKTKKKQTHILRLNPCLYSKLFLGL